MATPRRRADTRFGRRRQSPASLQRHWSNWSQVMKWETPQASDMRYGFEITMYIANR